VAVLESHGLYTRGSARHSHSATKVQVRILGKNYLNKKILLKNPIAEALFMLIDVERRMIFHCGSSLQ
jgi:hypothetical protein